MKIIHVTLCGPYSDGWSYQENMLAKYHKKMGLEVCMIASQWSYDSDGKLVLCNKRFYVDDNGIKVYRIKNTYGSIDSKFKRYEYFISILTKEKPDIIFVHGCQFIDIKQIKRYVCKNKCTLYVDNHSDFSNSATNFISRLFLHGFFWKHYARLINPFVKSFYGVLPARCDFLTDIYKLPSSKVHLLLMGGDDELIELYSRKESIKATRESLGISEKDFLIITGGKIDKYKTQILSLMRVVNSLRDTNVKLLVFGPVDSEIKPSFDALLGNGVLYIKWISPNEIYKYFAASQLGVFPGRHSVLWEQAVSQGLPIVVKHWDKTNHVDCGGNVVFLHKDNPDEIRDVLSTILDNSNNSYETMKKRADEAKGYFSYSSIAKKSIEMD